MTEGKEDDRGGTAEVRSFLFVIIVLLVLLRRGFNSSSFVPNARIILSLLFALVVVFFAL